jgi:hypothetical protein
MSGKTVKYTKDNGETGSRTARVSGGDQREILISANGRKAKLKDMASIPGPMEIDTRASLKIA